MMKTYNIGIVGYGGFGKFLHHWWNQLEGVKVVAVSDHRRDSEEYEGLKHYYNWEDLIADDAVDIVSIATPPAFHVEIACAAMRRNKHVLLEKPIALTNEGAQEIIRTQQETGMVITVDHMLRYNPIIDALKQLSQQEVFGKLRHAVVSNYAQDESLPPEHWFWNKAVSGGIFIEHGVHFFDIINTLTPQKFSKVYGHSHNRNDLQEDQVSATVLYDGGLIANHYHAFSGPGFFEQTTIRLTYDLARIEVEGWVPMKGRITALVNDGNREKLNIIPGFRLENAVPASDFTDVSRPEGWGNGDANMSNSIHFGGIGYNVEEMISASFEIPQTKSEVYGACLQKILSDLIGRIEDKAHSLGITLEDAAEALKIAILADQTAS